jgi:hypothetical protein
LKGGVGDGRAPIAPREGLPVRLGWAADAAVPVEEDADAA